MVARLYSDALHRASSSSLKMEEMDGFRCGTILVSARATTSDADIYS